MNLRELLHIWLQDDLSLSIELGPVVVVIIVVVALIQLPRLWKLFREYKTYDTELTVQLGGIGSVKLKANNDVAQIAHKAWTELATRKAGLVFDQEHDVLVEVYDSWYELFRTMRELIKSVPAEQFRDTNTKRLLDILVASLNKGMRPHLTKWQARFRKWYDREVQKTGNEDKTPQEIQKTFPQYDELLKDLLVINQQLVSYTDELQKLFRNW